MKSQEIITQELMSKLWQNYCQRVTYAQQYADMVLAKGGNVVNDHCAFRTFNTLTGAQKSGIEAISEVLESLGYEKIAPYSFPSKHLNSFHYQHPTNINFPKFFVTQLEVSELSETTQELINEANKRGYLKYTNMNISINDMQLLSKELLNNKKNLEKTWLHN